jgi:hypothetical protein
MREALAAAMAEVMRDLGDTSGLRPRVDDRSWSDVPGQPTAMLFGLDGSGQGVNVMEGETQSARIARS